MPSSDYLLRDVPPALKQAALAKARASGTPLRSVIISLLYVWLKDGVQLASLKEAPISRRRENQSARA
jgi:hypothetical protein